MEYVAGFLFNLDRTKVSLIRKTKPKWQNGFLNGIGGKIEDNETPIDAMCREFEEETGYKTFYYDWVPLIKLVNKNPDWIVNFYKGISKSQTNEELKTTTDEEIVTIDVIDLENQKIIPNLRWLIKMCLDDEVTGGTVLNSAKIK